MVVSISVALVMAALIAVDSFGSTPLRRHLCVDIGADDIGADDIRYTRSHTEVDRDTPCLLHCVSVTKVEFPGQLGCSRWSFTRIHKLRLHPLHVGYIRYISVTSVTYVTCRLHPLHIGYIRYISVTSVTSVTCRLHPLHPLHYMSVTKVEFPGRE